MKDKSTTNQYSVMYEDGERSITKFFDSNELLESYISSLMASGKKVLSVNRPKELSEGVQQLNG